MTKNPGGRPRLFGESDGTVPVSYSVSAKIRDEYNEKVEKVGGSLLSWFQRVWMVLVIRFPLRPLIYLRATCGRDYVKAGRMALSWMRAGYDAHMAGSKGFKGASHRVKTPRPKTRGR